MAAFGIAYIVTSPDIAAANARLRVLQSKFSDLTPVMQQAAAIAGGASERAFATESTPDGQLWPPLAKSTQNAKVARGVKRGAHPILQVHGQLAASLAPQVFPMSMVYGTNLIKAALLQFGGYAGRNHATYVPGRAYVGLGQRDLSEIEQAAEAFLAAF